MTDVAHLESVAAQLAARVREDDPEANLRWLRAELGTDPRAPVSDVERLLFIMASAVPDTERWSDLTAWCSGGLSPSEQARRAYQRTWVAARRAQLAREGGDGRTAAA